jgi:hypothetical protein
MAFKIDKHSATWGAVKAHVAGRKASLLSRLIGQLDWDETNRVRAQLRELEMVLALVVDDVPLVPRDEDDIEY